MSQAVLDSSMTPRRDRSTRFVLAFLFVSLALHAGGFWFLSTLEGRKHTVAQRPVELVMVEVQKPPPLVVGMTMSSTTSAGSFAAPVGNTSYGKANGTAKDPKEVKGYSAPKYVPVYQVDSEPTVASEVKIPYPDEARRAGIEGTVTLSITIDAEGKVGTVKVISGPGYGLDEAARDAIRRFRFKPAIKGGEAVATEMKYSYTFLLD
ncbi:energy transducer TonB [Corallococcus llansteffanensis]|uniref:Energy transducer TonB n=1 Tax=Corallococcus llansteffanensis TaxID=2316731 RepID=A0A3A8Q794_9BACT|nr:energy transducer TonB [Corallococcus llansteffanensis]RKH63998.1 energy transducer TonB [Corallococcus llansteffanensis]